MIIESTAQLYKRLQQANRSAKNVRKESLLAQEAHAKIQVEHRLERVHKRLVEAWSKI
jgi:hypothetical protein